MLAQRIAGRSALLEKMKTNKVILSYNNCPLKSYKYYIGKKGTISEYEKLLLRDKMTLKSDFISKQKIKLKPFTNINNLQDGFFSNVCITENKSVAKIDLLEKGGNRITPIIFAYNEKPTKREKLELNWISYVLQKKKISTTEGQIICTKGKSRVKKFSSKEIEKILFQISHFEEATPRLILNRNCISCEFRIDCLKKAKNKDDLSLLDRITRKQILQFEKKGIFTVNQLSYTYKPRKRSKKLRENHLYKPELQALAIRTKKVFIQKKPQIDKSDIEIYFDIEGINELNEFYLFGILIVKNDSSNYEYFYTKKKSEEVSLWQWFLKIVNTYKKAKIYHYGSYEVKIIKKFSKQYNTNIEAILKRMVNVNSFIYGKIYFPVYSNRLKDICNYLGFEWRTPNANGITSIVWRKNWKSTKDDVYINKTLNYNEDDCIALKKLKDYLKEIESSGESLADIDFLKQPKDLSSENSKATQKQLQLVLKSSYEHYQNVRISFSENKVIPKYTDSSNGSKWGYKGQRKKSPKPTKIIFIKKDKFCPIHKRTLLKFHPYKSANRLVIDLKLTANGIRKQILKYEGEYGYCKKCSRIYPPNEIRNIPPNTLYGHGLKAYICYNRIALRTPYQKIAELVNEQFNESIDWSYTVNYIVHLSKYFSETEKQIKNKILNSNIIHADETPLNIRGETQYAWIFTDGQYAHFKLSKTREATIVKELLKDYKGVLITDFYTAYDSLDCRKQKCWVHLIRDLNSDLKKNPFDAELESFVISVKEMFVPIMETVQKYGLKKRNLNKHIKKVDQFYEKVIKDKFYKSELVSKYQKRIAKYEVELFEFLKQDGIPWHNNQAERGIRHLAKQMVISGFLHESHVPAYLTLLSIMQTCRFTNKSFFHFLFSKEIDLINFKIKKKK